jgi:hypothetical protein
VSPRLLAPLLLLVGSPGAVSAQALGPPGSGGVAALADALEQLGAVKRVLVIAAHPDDEDNQLLTLVSRGLGAQAAYLSLTRGEGGQNLIGVELGPELGVLRSEELLAARAVDGARQFFTRAYDYGYSRSADEAFTPRSWCRSFRGRRATGTASTRPRACSRARRTTPSRTPRGGPSSSTA